MKALDLFLAEKDLDQVQITAEDYEAMQRALRNLADAPSFGGFGGPANFVHPALFHLYMSAYEQEELNKERITLIEWLMLLWFLKHWQESTNNLKPDLSDTAHKPDPEPDQTYMQPLIFGDGLLDSISTAMGIGDTAHKQKSKLNNSPRSGR